MKIFKITITALLLSFAAISCSPDTADVETQQNSTENVSEVETFSPFLSIRRRRR